MSEEVPFLSVPSKYGEEIRQRLLSLGIFDPNYRLVSKDGRLFFPLRRPLIVNELIPELNSIDYHIGVMDFPKARIDPRTLAEALRGILPDDELALLPRAYDLIGDIAVLEIPDEIAQHGALIGEKFLKIHRNFVTVLRKKSAITGIVRTRRYDLLAGVDKTDTIHTEYGCRIVVDLSRAYFSPRLLEEHRRVAAQVTGSEYVVDMFTGVGPFPLHIAKRTTANVIAVDVNPSAIDLLRKSMTLNRLKGIIMPVVSDIKRYVASVKTGTADRVIMNHPSDAISFIDEACTLLRAGGIMHYYDFIGGNDVEGTVIAKVQKAVESSGRRVRDVLLVRKVRDSAPYEYHVAVDAVIE